MAEVETRLYGIATDEETAVLDSLPVRAGLNGAASAAGTTVNEFSTARTAHDLASTPTPCARRDPPRDEGLTFRVGRAIRSGRQPRTLAG